MEKFRDRKFCLLLYPNEDSTHKKAIDIIEKEYDYALITHDSDINENNKLKKEHTHIVLRFNNAIWNTALAKDLGITENYIEKCRNLDKALMYLIHFNDIDKFQYDFEQVKGTLKGKLFRLLDNMNKDENEKSLELIYFIRNSGILSISDFSEYCATIGKWDIFRRSSIIYIEMIKEHNLALKNKN